MKCPSCGAWMVEGSIVVSQSSSANAKWKPKDDFPGEGDSRVYFDDRMAYRCPSCEVIVLMPSE